jgi:peptidyl-prolyl cis-trans isomerase SurA
MLSRFMTQRLSFYGAAVLAASLFSASPAHSQKLRVPPSGPPTPAAQTAPAQTETAAKPADAAVPADSQSPAYPVAEILVRINGQIISKADYDRAEQQLNEQAKEENWTPDELAQRKKAVLSDLIDQQLLLSRGKELGINADDELIRRLDEIRKQNHMDSMEDLEKAATAQGVSFEDFKANIRNSIITRQVIQQEVGKTLHLTSADALNYYNNHKDEFTLPEGVHLSEILIPAGTTDEELANAKARADKVYSELQGGSDFAEMAKSISTGPTAAQGGDLGVFKRGQLAKELEDKTFSLKAGQMTEPIRTRQGYVILKVLNHTPEGLQPYKDVQDQVEQQVYMERMQPALRAYLSKLRKEAFIDVKPGYVDVNASPNETKPDFSFTAYTPPQKKSKKKKESKERFRDRSYRASDRPPPPPKKRDSDDTVTDAAKKAPEGGPTAVATEAYKATEQQEAAQAASAKPATTPHGRKQASAAKPVNVSAKQPKPRKYKVRFGQGEKAAQLPPDTEDAAAKQAAGESAADASMESRLTPESQQMLGNEDNTPHKKTRFARTPVEPRKEVKEEKAEAKAETRKASTPPPPDAQEVATQAVNSAPLGLKGSPTPKAKATGDKQRYTKGNQGTEVAQNSSSSGNASTQTTAAATDTTEKKRHKLLGIL